MDKFITSYNNYTIWQLSEKGLMELAEFVVWENYKHHIGGELNDYFPSEIILVYNEEMRYFNRSRIFVTRDTENKIIGAIRLMNWDKKEVLPIQALFDIQNLNDISLYYGDTTIWHIGRLAVSADIGRYGLKLFKLLLLYAIYPIYKQEKGIVLAECDSKLLKTLRTMGIQVNSLGKGINYLGSETIPIYATYSGIEKFFNKNQQLILQHSYALP